MTIDHDLAWLMSMGYRHYGPYDPGTTLEFLVKYFNSADTLKLRTTHAFMLAVWVRPAWRPTDSECHVSALCTEPGAHWQGVKLLRYSVAWARALGCNLWRFHSETSSRIDALAKRVGAYQDTPRWRIDL